MSGAWSQTPFFDVEFKAAVIAARARERLETLAAGVPVSYLDRHSGINIMEEPDGRKLQIRFIPGAPYGRNYEIRRELNRTAA